MAEETEISWCDATFNPWIGCTKVSAACDFCYAERYGNRFGVQWGNHDRRRTSASYWKQPLAWNKKAKESGTRLRVFCASLADWLDNQVPDQWRNDLANIIEATPCLDWLLLTKRPQNFGKHAPWHNDDVPENVWIGTTIENQDEANRRIPYLLNIGTRVRFLSCEPILGPIDLRAVRFGHMPATARLDWVIAGGESGPHARPMNPDWARSLRDQCQTAGIYFHFKQWGGARPKSNGCALDGREWKEVPYMGAA